MDSAWEKHYAKMISGGVTPYKAGIYKVDQTGGGWLPKNPLKVISTVANVVDQAGETLSRLRRGVTAAQEEDELLGIKQPGRGVCPSPRRKYRRSRKSPKGQRGRGRVVRKLPKKTRKKRSKQSKGKKRAIRKRKNPRKKNRKTPKRNRRVRVLPQNSRFLKTLFSKE